LDTLDRNAEFVENTVEKIRGTEVEYFLEMFDSYRFFFNQVERFLTEAMHELNKKNIDLELEPNITFGLIERMTRYGEESQSSFLRFKPNVDKAQINKVAEVSELLNTWYGLIGDNLHSLSHLELIAQSLNNNFRHIEPFKDIKSEDIAIQRAGITLTKGDEVYIEGEVVKLEGQRRKIMILLARHYITNPSLPLSWIDIELEIRGGNGDMSKDVVVNRVSSLRTRLKELGFGDEVIEIKNAMLGDDTAWALVKH
jgi:hypothetical protein